MLSKSKLKACLQSLYHELLKKLCINLIPGKCLLLFFLFLGDETLLFENLKVFRDKDNFCYYVSVKVLIM